MYYQPHRPHPGLQPLTQEVTTADHTGVRCGWPGSNHHQEHRLAVKLSVPVLLSTSDTCAASTHAVNAAGGFMASRGHTPHIIIKRASGSPFITGSRRLQGWLHVAHLSCLNPGMMTQSLLKPCSLMNTLLPSSGKLPAQTCTWDGVQAGVSERYALAQAKGVTRQPPHMRYACWQSEAHLTRGACEYQPTHAICRHHTTSQTQPKPRAPLQLHS